MATTKCLLYCTKAKPYITNAILELYEDGKCINGHIVAECEVETKKLKKLSLNERRNGFLRYENEEEILKQSCLSELQLREYLLKTDDEGYALFIKNLKIFDEPKELKDYCIDNSKKYYGDFAWHLTPKEMYTPIQKAPQNMMWCFDKDNDYKMKVLISIRPEWLCKILNKEKTIEIRKKVLKGMCDDE